MDIFKDIFMEMSIGGRQYEIESFKFPIGESPSTIMFRAKDISTAYITGVFDSSEARAIINDTANHFDGAYPSAFAIETYIKSQKAAGNSLYRLVTRTDTKPIPPRQKTPRNRKRRHALREALRKYGRLPEMRLWRIRKNRSACARCTAAHSSRRNRNPPRRPAAIPPDRRSIPASTLPPFHANPAKICGKICSGCPAPKFKPTPKWLGRVRTEVRRELRAWRLAEEAAAKKESGLTLNGTAAVNTEFKRAPRG